jgi:hemerythrin superfamily protein
MEKLKSEESKSLTEYDRAEIEKSLSLSPFWEELSEEKREEIIKIVMSDLAETREKRNN